ncbi:MAG TPA: Sec-independent protein translocase subunit TatA [Dermatophilaceae bacterium]|jgi:sec-independent protein translocase protein TatA|nr:Sec-independent protein translocase subunit TatA [Dermatophilaceae bacterium]
MFRNIGAPEILILAVLLIVIFGFKRLPDAARSIGRSARVFKSEMQEMKNEAKSGDTIKGETVPGEAVKDSPVQENAPKTDNQSGPVS